MAELAVAAIPAIAAVGPAVEKGVQFTGEAISTAKEAAEDINRHALEVMKRKIAAFDYEKVFWNSAYSVGLVGLSYVAVKFGQFIIGLTNILNSIPILGMAIDDVTVESMNAVGTALNKIDNTLGGILPAVPIAMIGVHSALEYKRIRPLTDGDTRKIGDAAVGIGGLYAIFLAWGAYQESRKPPAEEEAA